MAIDFKALFARVMYEEMGEAFMRHGITEIREEDFDQIVTEITRAEYWPTLAECRRATGQGVVPRMRLW